MDKPITEDLLSYHQQKIQYFQHERLIHLLVTLTVGLALLFSVFITFLIPKPVIFFIDALFFLLFIPYLIHYRGLENGVQRLYKITDQLYKTR